MKTLARIYGNLRESDVIAKEVKYLTTQNKNVQVSDSSLAEL